MHFNLNSLALPAVGLALVSLVACGEEASGPVGVDYSVPGFTVEKLLDKNGVYTADASSASLKDSLGISLASYIGQPKSPNSIELKFQGDSSSKVSGLAVLSYNSAPICAGKWSIVEGKILLDLFPQGSVDVHGYCPGNTGPFEIKISQNAMAIDAKALISAKDWIVFRR